MPKKHFTETNLTAIPHGATTWYSHDGDKYAGLRLCVTQTAKTWYVSKSDIEAQKTRAVKLGRYPAFKLDAAWEKAQAEIGKIDRGELNRPAPEPVAALPTFAHQLDAYLAYHAVDRKNGRPPLKAQTAKEYRASVDKHFATWKDKPLNEIDGRAVSKAMDNLQAEHPYAAQRLHVIVRAVFKFDEFPGVTPPRGLRGQTKMEAREFDRTIKWEDRLKEIDGIKNEFKRLCWLLRWHTGSRENVLREMTWDRVDLEKGTITYERIKRDEKGRTIALSDHSWGLMRQLHDLRQCNFVFPSLRRMRKDGRLVQGHLDALDRLPLTNPGDLRHLWHDTGMVVGTSPYMMRWLNGQNLKTGEVDMLGHYGQIDDIGAQRIAANKISAYIISRCTPAPSNVVAFQDAKAI